MTHYITNEGLKKLEKELQELEKVRLPEALDSINRALAEGDVSENSALDSAKLERDKLEARVNEIKEVISNHEIIEESKGASKVVRIGGSVKIEYLDSGKTFELTIVGASEADAVVGKISNESPLAKAILGKRESSEVTVRVNPTSTFKVKIVKIIH